LSHLVQVRFILPALERRCVGIGIELVIHRNESPHRAKRMRRRAKMPRPPTHQVAALRHGQFNGRCVRKARPRHSIVELLADTKWHRRFARHIRCFLRAVPRRLLSSLRNRRAKVPGHSDHRPQNQAGARNQSPIRSKIKSRAHQNFWCTPCSLCLCFLCVRFRCSFEFRIEFARPNSHVPCPRPTPKLYSSVLQRHHAGHRVRICIA